MLLAVFVCTYFKKEKKSQIHFSDIVRLPYCLSFLIAGPSPRLEVSWWRRREVSKKGHFCQKGMPLGDVTHLAGPIGRWGDGV